MAYVFTTHCNLQPVRCSSAALEVLQDILIAVQIPCDLAGEIIPQALCKSYALLIGNYCAPMVRVLCYAVGIISWPVSKVLDYVLGNEHTVSLSLA